ncbi:putative pectinesterase/pectinesterase inhibitor 36 [Glycine max]|nr:putative pectinesterase/pectinesterase inhibitor 36 [Glycine max]
MIYGHLNNITISKPLQETLSESEGGLLASWSSGTSNADFTVAQDGSDVSGDGFWARDMTFENRAGPRGHQAVALRVKPAYDFDSSKDSITSYLGRPWKQYSRTLFLKTNLDGLIDPNGWGEWIKDFALSTLYYGEYMNTRSGASTQNRVTWSGFHV